MKAAVILIALFTLTLFAALLSVDTRASAFREMQYQSTGGKK